MKIQNWVFTIGLSFFLGMSCSSNSKTTSFKGLVQAPSGEPVSGIAVRLISRDDRGTELAELDQTITDSAGRFHFTTDATPGSTIFVEALGSSATWYGFAFDTDDTTVSPLTNALVTAVLQITAPDGGATLSQFSSANLLSLTKAVNVLDRTSVDLNDASATYTYVVAQLGRSISEASGASVLATSSASFDPAMVMTTPTFVTTTTCGLGDVMEFKSSQFTFDLLADGETCEGYSDFVSDTFDGAFQLSIPTDLFTSNSSSNFPTDSLLATLQDDRTLVIGPELMVSGLEVTRKIYVPTTGDMARYLEILHNPTAGDISLTLDVFGDLGSDAFTELLVRDVDSTSLSTRDRFAATYDKTTYKPTVGYVWQDRNGVAPTSLQFVESGNPETFHIAWQNVTVAAGETKTFVNFAYQTTDQNSTSVISTLRAVAETPDMTGLTAPEISHLQNFAPSRGNVVGEPGSVVWGSTVTITNQTTSEVVTVKSRSDWSFYAPVTASSGDTIHIASSDGFSKDVIVP